MTRGAVVLGGAGAILLFSAAVLEFRNPFRTALGGYSTDLAGRSPGQRSNINEGARRLDGAEISAGEAFSFNRRVGPRTLARGFVAAPAFLEGTRLESVGGGICQVSSTLYGAALAAGMTVTRRVPHDRVVESVPPGADATVWYGKADLAFRNPNPGPVRLRARTERDRLTITILGTRDGPEPVVVRQKLPPPRPGTVQVVTWRVTGDRRELVSRDLYRK